MSATAGLPAISLPRATVSKLGVSANILEFIISDKNTICLFGFGISSPIYVLPGIVSTTLMLETDNALARSFDKFIT